MPATSLIITHHDMRSARHVGQARPLSPDITEFTRYRGTWWVTSAGGRLRITGTGLADRLDSASALLDTQNAARLRSGQQGERREKRSWTSGSARL